eukprot:TRINITY_DN31725_c0_g1_i1.p1 TRINITY_DN31725_c0_g1~~TRINITY_DN31725_c0_g1_i1.p1  ORF type:complete len:501 (-),score=126.26 TRINITY_DN31725_c0_g1_i1:74-1576(-)
MGAACSQKEVEDDEPGQDEVQQEDDAEPEQQEDPKALRKWVLEPGKKMTVMMFGMTGAGKSALGNLMADMSIFQSGDDTASVTNLDSIMKFEAEDKSLVLLDTIGLGDTEIDQDKVVANIRDVALSAPNGVDCLFYVMRNARVTDDAISRLIYVTDSLLNLYIVVTNAARYAKNRADADDWIKRQVEINWRFKHIFGIVGNNLNRFIFIDNPDPDSGEQLIEERREASHEAVFKVLCQHPRDAVPPFTQAMMKQVAEMTKVEREALDEKEKEVQRLQDEVSKKTNASAKKKGKKVMSALEQSGPKTQADETLELYLKQAKEDLIKAERTMKAKLDQVKSDKNFQEQARKQAESATLRFSRDFKDKEGEKAQAAGRAISALSRRLFSGPSSSAKNTAALAEAAAPAETEKPTEEQLKAILNKVRTSVNDTPANIYTSLGGWVGAGALSPMVFTKFILTHAPSTSRQQIGALWWRADTNSDGQVDLTEFKDFFKNHVEAAAA